MPAVLSHKPGGQREAGGACLGSAGVAAEQPVVAAHGAVLAYGESVATVPNRCRLVCGDEAVKKAQPQTSTRTARAHE